MHQPLSNSQCASIVFVFTYENWTQSHVHALFTFTQQLLESLFFDISPASLVCLFPPSLLVPRALPHRFSSFALCISFISTHTVPIPTRSHRPPPAANFARIGYIFWIPIPFWAQTRRIRAVVKRGDGWEPRGFIICMTAVADKQQVCVTH